MAVFCPHRDEGNKNFLQGKYYEALLCYNQSLISAKKHESGESLSLAFANRSAVYLNVKQYKLCLENIQLAKEHSYPAKKMPKLIEREENCKKIMKDSIPPDPEEDPRNFFKLSHPANPKIPFIVDCLEMREDMKYGRGIYATRDLKAGDVIAIEKPFLFNLILDGNLNYHKRCAICMESNMLSLIPNADGLMFCSDQCLNEGSRLIRKLSDLNLSPTFLPFSCYLSILKVLDISGGYEELHAIYTNPKSTNVFDYDLSDLNDPETRRNMLKCVASLRKREEDNSSMQQCIRQSSFSGFHNLTILSDFFLRQGAINQCNNVGIQVKEENHGNALFLFASFLNHSCDASIDAFFIDSDAAFITSQPIKAGEQLFLNYMHSFTCYDKTKRKQELLEAYQFNCECNACVSDYPVLGELPRFDRNFTSPMFHQVGSVKESIAEVKRNWRYITKNIERHPSMETALVMMRTEQLLGVISDLTYCPF